MPSNIFSTFKCLATSVQVKARDRENEHNSAASLFLLLTAFDFSNTFTYKYGTYLMAVNMANKPTKLSSWAFAAGTTPLRRWSQSKKEMKSEKWKMNEMNGNMQIRTVMLWYRLCCCFVYYILWAFWAFVSSFRFY